MNFIPAALAGYTGEQILEFIVNSFPSLGRRIKQAKKVGYDTKDILDFVKNLDKEKLTKLDRKASQEPMDFSNPLISAQRTTLENSAQTQVPNIGANLAKTAVAGYALSRALPKGIQALSGMMPQSLEKVAEQVPVTPTPQQNPEVTSPQQAAPTPEQTLNKIAPEIKNIKSEADVLWNSLSQGKTDSKDMETSAFLKVAKNLKTTGVLKNKEDFDRLYESFFQKKSEGKKAPEIARELFADVNKMVDNKPEAQTKEVAALPSGQIGDIESVKNGIAAINIDGKLKHRKLSELIKEPEEVRIALNDILQIPESERSSAMDLLHYTDKHKLLHIMFPNGKIAWYEDIEPNIVDDIIAAKGTPKTSGKTTTGESWAAGIPDSRFATVSERIIRNPKYSKENEGKTWGYIGKQYDKFKALRTKAKEKTPRKGRTIT